MKSIWDNFRTTLGQLIDNSSVDDNKTSINIVLDDDDTVCEQVITQCQREHGKLMTSTSQKLRKKYNDSLVDRVRDRLSKRRQRGNQRQEIKNDKLIKLLEKLMETETKQITL
jgi:flagellar biosynthesis component FlhA